MLSCFRMNEWMDEISHYSNLFLKWNNNENFNRKTDKVHTVICDLYNSYPIT